MSYDIIGDIHGCGDTLTCLLTNLGYVRDDRGVFRHPDRTVIFLGDFVDRGPQQREVISIVRAMIDAGVGEDGELLPWDADWKEYRGHPRTAGTRGKTFRMAREQGVPLMFTIAQASYWVAKHLGDTGIESMQERGRLQVGKVADITIFDPQTITDNSGFKVGEHGIPTTGIPYVVVNGKVVVKDSEVLAVKAGQEIRFPVEPKGRFAPIAVGGWLNQHTIGLNPDLLQIHLDDDSGAGELLHGTE